MNRPQQSRHLGTRALIVAAFLAITPLCSAMAQAPAAPAVAAITPTASSIAIARQIVINTQQKLAFQAAVAQMMDQLTTTTLRTHPEVAADLKTVLTQLEPSFMQNADTMVDKAAIIYASMFTEAELKEINAFYGSATGKKFATSQPFAYQQIGAALKPWQDELSLKMLDEMRQEMKKKGHDL